MAEDIIRVDPDALRQGATAFTNHHRDLSELFDAVRRGNDELQSVWNGDAADSVAEAWEQMRPAIGSHIEQLAAHATKLNAAADSYAGQDSANADPMRRT